MTPYEQLLHLAFTAPNDVKYYLTPTALRAYDQLRAAPPAHLPFRFEQVRLGLAMSLLKLVSELGDHDESRQVLDVLHRALSEARSPEDIDRIVGRDARLFDRLYENLYVNEEGEELLNLTQAGIRSGYTPDSLRRMIHDGKLENLGRKNAPRLRARDLPRKPLRPPAPRLQVADASRQKARVSTTTPRGGN